MIDNVFNSTDDLSYITSTDPSYHYNNTMDNRRRRPAAQHSANAIPRSPRYSEMDDRTQESISTNRYQSHYDIAKSEPDLLDSKYIEYRRPWYNNPEYKGPRNQIYSATGSNSNVQNIKFTSTHPRDMSPSSNITPDLYDTSRYSSTSSRRHAPKEKRLRNQNSIVSETFDNNSAFYSFENLMEDVGGDAENMMNLSVAPKDGRSSGYRFSSSPESAFSTQNSSTGSSAGGGGLGGGGSSATGPLNYQRNRTIKNRSASSRRPPPVSNLEVEEEIMPVNALRSSACPSPMPQGSKQHLDVYNSNMRASSLSRSDYSDLNEVPRRSVGSDGFGSGKSSTSNYTQAMYNTGKSSSPTGLLPFGNVIDEKVIRRHRHRPSIQSTTCSSSASVTDDYDQRYKVKPLCGTQQAMCEALFHIFTYLDTKSLARSGAVCRTWYAISREPVLWRKVRIMEATLTPRTMDYLTKWCIQVKELSFHKVKSSVSTDPEFETKEFQLNRIEASMEKMFMLNRTTLKILRIVDCNEVITGRVLWTASMHCSKLNKLVYLSKTDPLGQGDLFPLGRGCPNIRSLIIPPGWPCKDPDKFNDSCCDTVAKCWSNLEVLCIGGRKLTSVGLNNIAKNCIKLQHLEIDHGPNITEDTASKMVSFGLRGLEKINFTFTPITPRAVVLFSNACPKLNYIGIHCNIKDYFSNYTTAKGKSDYNSLKTLFRRLKSRSVFAKILDVNLDYEDTSGGA